MGKRQRIGIPFYYSEGWIAGSYYIVNLVESLRILDDDIQPELRILSWKKSDFEIIQKTKYPYLKYLPLNIPYNILERMINKASRILMGMNIIEKKYGNKDMDIVFPYHGSELLRNVTKKIFWIPDFQDRYYPDFFSPKEVTDRKAYQDSIALSDGAIIFSSDNARNDFSKFYPGNKCRTFVLHFASSHPEYTSVDIEKIKKQYNISGNYFMTPNQFWKHKNHLIVLKAIKLLKEMNIDVIVVFTGKEEDHRNPDYFSGLKSYVIQNNLQEHVRFLGFIDRKLQLKLMSSALAIIQPSLFEGWSTVVEDSKEMNQYVILSDIGVHREQLDYNVSFFDPFSEKMLSEKMLDVLGGNIAKTIKDYNLNVRKFGIDFINIINNILN